MIIRQESSEGCVVLSHILNQWWPLRIQTDNEHSLVLLVLLLVTQVTLIDLQYCKGAHLQFLLRGTAAFFNTVVDSLVFTGNFLHSAHWRLNIETV